VPSGPGAPAGLITHLTVGLRIPRRGIEQLLATALSIEISLGSTQKLIEESSEALAATCQELERQLPQEPVLNSDETGWRSMGDRRWLWALVASSFVFFTVAATRSSQVLVHLLGTVFAGILCSDRFGAYLKYHKGRAQFCWAHLKRGYPLGPAGDPGVRSHDRCGTVLPRRVGAHGAVI